jgi:hypothetical protein
VYKTACEVSGGLKIATYETYALLLQARALALISSLSNITTQPFHVTQSHNHTINLILNNGTSHRQRSFKYQDVQLLFISQSLSLLFTIQTFYQKIFYIRPRIGEMTRLNCCSYLLLFIVITVSQVRCDDESTVSLCNSGSSLWNLRSCAVGCIDNGTGMWPKCDELACQLSCCGGDPLNTCFCRSDLLPVAVSIISVCVLSGCQGNTRDVASAIGLYTNYCSSTSIAQQPIVLATTTTIGAAPTSSVPPVIISTATVTVSSAAGSTSTAPADITLSAYRLLFMCAGVSKASLQAPDSANLHVYLDLSSRNTTTLAVNSPPTSQLLTSSKSTPNFRL